MLYLSSSTLRYPLFVKPARIDGSIGIDQGSVVKDHTLAGAHLAREGASDGAGGGAFEFVIVHRRQRVDFLALCQPGKRLGPDDSHAATARPP